MSYENNIIVGDCIDVMSHMPKNSVDLLLTDIPYNMTQKKYGGKGGCGMRKINRHGSVNELNFNVKKFTDLCCKVSKGSIYIFCSPLSISDITSVFIDNKLTWRLCVWKKTNPMPMNGQFLWLSGLEFCMFARKPKATFNERCKSALWEFPCGHSKIHPTEKPLGLFRQIIEVSSNPGDLVFDPCAGSGTTAVAAQQLERGWIIVDISQEYCDIARQRLQNGFC
jgi:site-specific DNA-methyltransferase (adenine-specific)